MKAAPKETTPGVPMNVRDELQKIGKGIDGALYVSLMGFDGIAIESFKDEVREAAADPELVLAEYSNAMQMVIRAAEALQAGALAEVTINTGKLVTIIRPLSAELFVAAVLDSAANFGKARYLLRMSGPKLLAELN